MGTIQIDGSTPKLTIGNATAEDATILFDGNAQDFYIALDDSADDLVIGLGSTLGTTTHMSFDETGAVLKPLQPAFLVLQTTGITAQTLSDNAATTISFNGEIFDVNSDYDGTNTFTAPVTGKYFFATQVGLDAGSSSNTSFETIGAQIVASNRTFYPNSGGTAYTDSNDKGWASGSALVDMDASDTCTIGLFVKRTGGTATTTTAQVGATTGLGTYWSGHLVC